MFDWLKLKKEPVHAVVQQFELVAWPSPDTPVSQCRFLVLDIETTGLDAKNDHIVSIGWLLIEHQEINLAQARHVLIKTPVSVGQSAVFHGLHDKDLSEAQELAEAITELLQQYAGAVFVAHHASIEQKFLTMACQRLYGRSPKFKFIDTMQLEWQRLLNQGKVIHQRDLRLPSCLNRHHLPQSQHHHALEDAFSCALLLLSQLKKSRDQQMTLGELQALSRG
ncbi:exonuclease domain-containing protein [Rheinheimera sp.]|uniref:exonuclease domain-containing protein n=1 Tax=Rheinheimera sp. TaxID=1869214 RepID=UPI0027B989C5|nr:exonuclease domain-containing protein [Rheinheimera sp.]